MRRVSCVVCRVSCVVLCACATPSVGVGNGVGVGVGVDLQLLLRLQLALLPVCLVRLPQQRRHARSREIEQPRHPPTSKREHVFFISFVKFLFGLFVFVCLLFGACLFGQAQLVCARARLIHFFLNALITYNTQTYQGSRGAADACRGRVQCTCGGGCGGVGDDDGGGVCGDGGGGEGTRARTNKGLFLHWTRWWCPSPSPMCVSVCE